jgi:hypothetical protein
MTYCNKCKKHHKEGTAIHKEHYESLNIPKKTRKKDGVWAVKAKRKKSGGLNIEFSWTKKDTKKIRKVGSKVKNKVLSWDEKIYRKMHGYG